MCTVGLPRPKLAFWVVVVLTLAVLGLPAPSLGSTAALTVVPAGPGGFPPASPAWSYRAAPGEANRLVVDFSMKAGLVTVTATDPGAVISPGGRCASSGAHSVRCSYQGPGGFDLVVLSSDVRLGDGNDSALFNPPQTGATDLLAVQATADGGTGDDQLTTAPSPFLLPGADSLRGGPGNDVLRNASNLDGGGGRDELHGLGVFSSLTDGDKEGSVDGDILDGGGGGSVDYSSRTRPLHVDLRDPAPNGERGEGDRITGVSSVTGGRANDFLGGTAGNDQLAGGPGNDRIDGRNGADSISVNGRDRAFGGPGNDEFSQDGGRSSFEPTIVCGPGNDASLGASKGPGPWLSKTCETVADDLAEDVVLSAPPHPVAASRRGRLVLRVDPSCERGKYRLTLTSGRGRLRRLVERRFKLRGCRRGGRRVALKLPSRVARFARRRVVRLRERISFTSRGVGRHALVWRFDLRLRRH